MLKKEILNNEEQEAANAHEPLFHPSDGKDPTEKNIDEDSKHKESPGNSTSEKAENQTNENNDALDGSTVEIIQPADLKPKHLGFTRTLLLAMFAAMIGTGAQFGYALGVMNAPSEVVH